MPIKFRFPPFGTSLPRTNPRNEPRFQRTELRLTCLRRKCHGPKHALPGRGKRWPRAGGVATCFNQSKNPKNIKKHALNPTKPSETELMNMFWIPESHCWTGCKSHSPSPCLMFSRTYRQAQNGQNVAGWGQWEKGIR